MIPFLESASGMLCRLVHRRVRGKSFITLGEVAG